MWHVSPITRKLCALLLFHGVVVTLGLHLAFSVPRAGTLAHHVDAFAARSQAGDSWKPMAAARVTASEHPGASIYEEVFFRNQTKFQYPPTSLLFVGSLGRPALNAISWCAVWLTVLITVVLFEGALRQTGTPIGGVADRTLRALVLAALALTFYPLVKAYSLGQIQVWIDLAFAALVWAWWRGAPGLSGVALGLVCLIKPHFILLAGWGVARKQWRFASACAGTVAAGLALSLAAFGLPSHLDYLRVISYISRRGEAFYANQSMNGLLNRAFGNGDSLVWHGNAFPPEHAGVYAGTLLLGAVLVGAALLLPRRAVRGSLLDLSIGALTIVVVSPIAWEHHFGILLPLLAVTTPRLLSGPHAARWTPVVLGTAFVLTGQYFEPAQRLASSWLNVLQSYVLIGALLLLAVWHKAARRSVSIGSPHGMTAAD